jgi:hypothetical protein
MDILFSSVSSFTLLINDTINFLLISEWRTIRDNFYDILYVFQRENELNLFHEEKRIQLEVERNNRFHKVH